MKQLTFALLAITLITSCSKAWQCTTKKTTDYGNGTTVSTTTHKFVGNRHEKKIHEELYSSEQNFSGVILLTETKCN